MPPWAPPAAPAPPAPLNIFKSIRLLMESPPAPLSIIRGRRLFIPPIIPPAAEPDLARLRRCSNILFRAFWAAAAAEEDSAGLLPVAAANYRRKKKVLSAKAKQKVQYDWFQAKKKVQKMMILTLISFGLSWWIWKYDDLIYKILRKSMRWLSP